MCEQISFIPLLVDEDVEDLKRQAKLFSEYAKNKRNWEDAFQRWSNKSFENDGTDTSGVCGCSRICDWCEANEYGRPCVRALNAMCRDKGIKIDYSKRNFEEIWNM